MKPKAEEEEEEMGSWHWQFTRIYMYMVHMQSARYFHGWTLLTCPCMVHGLQSAQY